MFNKFSIVLLLSLLIMSFPFLSPLHSARQVSQRDTERHSTFSLSNGLLIVVIPDHRAKVATHMLWYKVGSGDEPIGQSGIAHFLEHLMFKGTHAYPAGEFSDLVSRSGGTENAFTSDDYTAYFQRVPPNLLERVMELEADRMKNLVLDESDIEPERLVILEERSTRTDNRAAGQFREAMNSTLYRNHPYGIPIIGWRHEIESLTKDQILSFYARHYSPDNAILVVAGDVDASAVLSMAKRTYGKIDSTNDSTAVRFRPIEPPSLAARRVRMHDARVQNPIWQRYYLVGSYLTSDDGPALDVLSEILGGGTTSRFYQSLVLDSQLTTHTSVSYHGSRLDETILSITALPAPDIDWQDVESAIDSLLVDFLSEGIDSEELERAQNRLVRAMIYAQDSQQTLARIYGVALALGQDADDVNDWSDKIRSVTKSDVDRVARKYLSVSRSVTGILLPESESATESSTITE